MEIEVIDLALDELALFESTTLALQWHEVLSIWFSGAVIPIALVS